MSTTMIPMPSETPPEPTKPVWEELKFLWIMLAISLSIGILFFTHKTYLAIRFRRAQLQQPQDLPSAAFERNWGDTIPLQRLQRVVTRNETESPVPLYESHVSDQGLSPAVKLEKRGKYHYVAKEEDLPTYRIIEERRPYRS